MTCSPEKSINDKNSEKPARNRREVVFFVARQRQPGGAAAKNPFKSRA
jgi:hypothetical protein